MNIKWSCTFLFLEKYLKTVEVNGSAETCSIDVLGNFLCIIVRVLYV